MSGNFVCEFCNKEYTSLSNLNYHKKNAKFCIEIQQEKRNVFSCEHCKKEFNNSRYLKQHLQRCKSKKENIVQMTTEKLNKLEKESLEKIYKLQTELSELKITITFKDEIIKKLEKENSELKKLEKRPNKTTIVNNTIDNSNTHNYQLQFNQLFENIHKLTSQAINYKIPRIAITEINKYDIKNIESSFSKSLSNIFKEFTFCSDINKKEFVIKNENGEINKMHVDEFVKYGLTLGVDGINKFINVLEDNYYNKVDANKLTREEYDTIIDSIRNIEALIRNINKDSLESESDKLLFKTFTQDTLKKCDALFENQDKQLSII